jgi:hypothetical protein
MFLFDNKQEIISTPAGLAGRQKTTANVDEFRQNIVDYRAGLGNTLETHCIYKDKKI